MIPSLSESVSESLEKYQIGEYSEKNGHPVLTIIENEESDKKVLLKMDGQEDLAKAMYRYSGMIAIDATCSSDNTLLDYSIESHIYVPSVCQCCTRSWGFAVGIY